MTPSPRQLEIYKAFKETDKHICVQATAGSGKTTTILELLNFVPKFRKAIFLSFSNGIVSELKERVPVGIQASTLHSLGCRAIMRCYHGTKVDENKYFKKALFTYYSNKETRDKDAYKECFRLQDICNFARMTYADFNEEALAQMCEYYGLDFSLETLNRAVDLLTTPYGSKVIDFTDMIYLPLKDKNITIDKFDFVFLDEAQDLNNCQRLFVEKLLAPKGRLISVGDKYQSIYSFAGSSIDSFEKLQKKENTIVLPLDVSYRCPKAVVRQAQKVCTTINYFENSIEGEVRSGNIDEIKAGDLVICRNTRPLIALYFYLLENDIRCKVVGKDIETGLLQLATRCKSYSREIFVKNLNKELQTLVDELKDMGVKIATDHPRYIALVEKIQVLTVISRKLEPGEDIIEKIKFIFSDDADAAKLMTLHRSKGLENKRVFIVERFNKERLLPSKHATKDWEMIQENNLAFVAYTRAKESLIFLNFDE